MKTTNWKRTLVCMIVILFAIACTLTACSSEPENRNPYNVKVIEATADFYVNDFAGILSESQKADMMDKAIKLDSEYSGIQVVVTTVESFEKTVKSYEENPGQNVYDIEQLAYAMYSQYGIGRDDMGILILFSVGDREVRIETGYQMQNYITDIKSGQLLDNYGMEYFANDQFADGLVSVQDAVIKEIRSVVPNNWADSIETENEETVTDTDSSLRQQETHTTSNESKSTGVILATFIVLILAIFGVIRGIFANKLRKIAEAHASEIDSLRAEHSKTMEENRQNYQSNLDAINSQHEKEMHQKEIEIKSLKQRLSASNNQLGKVKSELSEMKDKLRRIKTLHPEFDFEQEVADMIEREYQREAQKIDEKLSKVIETKADKDKVTFFATAIELFANASPNVQKYVKTDIGTVRKLHEDSKSLKRKFDIAEQEKADKATAEKVCDEIRNVFNDNPEGNHETYKELGRALALYTGLTIAQQRFFPDTALLEKLQRAVEEAKVDYINYSKAKSAEDEVKSIIGYMSSADEDDRSKLSRAKDYYNRLSSAERDYFDSELLRKLNRLIKQADDDYEEQERRRRQRRQQSMSSSSSCSNSSSFGGGHSGGFSGRGGRPSGGGASRHF